MHCGYCVPCLIRRAAILASFKTDDTRYAIPDLTERQLDAGKAEGRDVRSFQIATARLEQNPNLAKSLIHKPGPLKDCIGELEELEQMYLAGMNEVAQLLKDVAC